MCFDSHFTSFLLDDQINNKVALVGLMVWYQIGKMTLT